MKQGATGDWGSSFVTWNRPRMVDLNKDGGSLYHQLDCFDVAHQKAYTKCFASGGLKRTGIETYGLTLGRIALWIFCVSFVSRPHHKMEFYFKI